MPAGNTENRTYGLTICAERSAVTRARQDGSTDFVALAVVTDASPPAPPCGLCLETLTEFVPDLPIVSANLEGERIDLTLRQLLPVPFVFAPPENDKG